MSKMVRLSHNAAENLENISNLTGKSKQSIIEKALNKLYREEFLKKTNEEFEILMADPQLWEEELKERELWDATLNDGLEPYE